MKKIALLVLVAAFVAAPAMAKKKMTKEEAEAAEIAKQHDNTARALRDMLGLMMPAWSQPRADETAFGITRRR